MFNLILIDSELMTDQRISDRDNLESAISDLFENLGEWSRRWKMDMSSFAVIIRDIHLGGIVATMLCHKKDSGVITIVKDNNTFELVERGLRKGFDIAC